MAGPRHHSGTSNETSEPSQYPSTLTPAGIVQSYGNLFGAIHGRSRRRQIGALVLALLIVTPLLFVGVGVAMIILRAI
jgi:hypothetical protein